MIEKSWIGYELAPSVLEIDGGRLRAFAKAIGESDPVYSDREAARAAGYADLPVPPTFLFAAELDSGANDKMLADLGIPIARILHGEQGFTFHKPVCAGDVVTVRSRIVDIYDKKDGALEFVEKLSQASNRRGDLVAELRSLIVVRNPPPAIRERTNDPGLGRCAGRREPAAPFAGAGRSRDFGGIRHCVGRS